MRTGPWEVIGAFSAAVWHASSPKAMLRSRRSTAMATARKPTLRGRRLYRSLWQIVRIYWTSPDAKWGALLLVGAVALEFGTVRTTFYVSEVQRNTVEALEHRDASA